MDKIRNKLNISDRILPETYWDVTKSGKVLELRVRPSIDQAPANYRLGIIQIGRVISRIQTLAKHNVPQPQIQLFPNLAENQLAATVYWPGLMEDLPLEKSNRKHSLSVSAQRIKHIAEHYDLTLSLSSSETIEDGLNEIFFVLSNSNQPFIWLKVGQFIQDLTEQTDTSDVQRGLSIEVLSSNKPDRDVSCKKVSYRQVKISIHRKV